MCDERSKSTCSNASPDPDPNARPAKPEPKTRETDSRRVFHLHRVHWCDQSLYHIMWPRLPHVVSAFLEQKMPRVSVGHTLT